MFMPFFFETTVPAFVIFWKFRAITGRTQFFAPRNWVLTLKFPKLYQKNLVDLTARWGNFHSSEIFNCKSLRNFFEANRRAYKFNSRDIDTVNAIKLLMVWRSRRRCSFANGRVWYFCSLFLVKTFFSSCSKMSNTAVDKTLSVDVFLKFEFFN